MLEKSCVKCGKTRSIRMFRNPVICRKRDGTAIKSHRITNECHYCFRARMEKGRDFTLIARAQHGKVNLVVALEKAKLRERDRRWKISKAVSDEWKSRHRAQIDAHPVKLEHDRMRAVQHAANNSAHHATEGLRAFTDWYVGELTALYWQMRDTPRLAYPTHAQTRKGQAFDLAVSLLEKRARQRWVSMTPDDRGLYAPPKKLTPRQ